MRTPPPLEDREPRGPRIAPRFPGCGCGGPKSPLSCLLSERFGLQRAGAGGAIIVLEGLLPPAEGESEPFSVYKEGGWCLLLNQSTRLPLPKQRRHRAAAISIAGVGGAGAGFWVGLGEGLPESPAQVDGTLAEGGSEPCGTEAFSAPEVW